MQGYSIIDISNLAVQGFCMATATQHLIEMHLKGKSLRAVVVSARRSGRSWQSVADEIRELTGVIVSRESVRGWYPDTPSRNKIPA